MRGSLGQAKQALNHAGAWFANDRGLETVEWIAVGAVLLTLVASVYGVFTGNGDLRAALTGSVGAVAVNFGQDMNVPGPALPDQPGRVTPNFPAPITPPRNLAERVDPLTGMRVIVDPARGNYALIDPRFQTVTLVTPSANFQARMDTSTGLIDMRSQTRDVRANFDPLMGKGIAVNTITAEPTPVDLTALEQMGLVRTQRMAPRRLASPTAYPVLGVPALLAINPATLTTGYGQLPVVGSTAINPWTGRPVAMVVDPVTGALVPAETPIDQGMLLKLATRFSPPHITWPVIMWPTISIPLLVVGR